MWIVATDAAAWGIARAETGTACAPAMPTTAAAIVERNKDVRRIALSFTDTGAP
jgi:hypothetical protein